VFKSLVIIYNSSLRRRTADLKFCFRTSYNRYFIILIVETGLYCGFDWFEGYSYSSGNMLIGIKSKS
jgi:hypothetical protein